MKQIFDEDTANEAYLERQQQTKASEVEHSKVMRMTPGKRKNLAFRNLYPKFALTGLSTEELNRPW
jgi:hypothetical protein